MAAQVFRVPIERDGWPLEEFLADRFARVARVGIRRILLAGRVRVNDGAGWIGRRLAAGDAVRIDPREIPAAPPPESPAFLLLEGDLAVVNKPAGIPVVAERRPKGPCLLDLLREGGGGRGGEEWLPVHRLDRDTTGVLVVARSREAHRDLSLQFQERRVRKEYLALVLGEMDQERGRIDLPIGHDPRDALKMRAGGRRGRVSATRYEVEERFRDYTLARVLPETGRTHQVRVHLAGVGHPLAVDPLYAGRARLLLSEIKPGYRAKRGRPERALMDRLTLHARKVRLRRPATGEELEVEAPLPRDLALVLKMLRKYRRGPAGARRGTGE